LNKSVKINENLKKDYELKLTKCNNEIKKLKNENKSTNKGTTLSPTLMAIFTQNFMNTNVNIKDSGTMKTLHKELKGMMHASKNTFEWFGKNIGNNDDMKSDNGSQICLNDYDLMSLCFMRNIGNQILNVNGKYTENVRNWVNKLNDCIKMKTNPVNYKKWKSNEILYWILNLENGKYRKKYEKKLREYLSKTNINGGNITKKSKLLDMSIFDLEDQQSILKHIGMLTKQNNDNNTSETEGYSQTFNNTSTKKAQLF